MTDSLRARKKAATEATLQRCALNLFAAKGYDQTTIEEIVADAQVSRRTFFRYFASKEEVIFKDAELDLQAVQRFVQERPSDESEIECVKKAMLKFVSYLEERQAPVLQFVDVILNSPSLRARSAELMGRWTQAVAQAMAERASSDVYLRPFLLASIGMATVTAGIQAWSSGREPDVETAVRNAFQPVEDGTLFG